METKRVEENNLTHFPFEDAVQFGTAPWIKEVREKAWAHFGEIGFPDSSLEFWKNTSLENLKKSYFVWGRLHEPEKSVQDLLRSLSFEVEKADVLVFLNGFFARKISKIDSLPQGVQITSILNANEDAIGANFSQILKYENRSFAALNTAYFTDGLYLKVPDGVVLPRPIHIVYLTTHDNPSNCQTHVRNLFLLGRDSSAAVIEHYLSEADNKYFVGALTEINLSQGSSLDHTKIQQESHLAYHLGSLAAHQAKGSQFIARVFSIGGSLGRSEVESSLAEPHAHCLFEGLTLGSGKQHLDVRTFVDHAVEQGQSEQLFKTVVNGHAGGVFDGRVLVRENAQKTDARQSNKNLQLSDTATVYAKPQLQIYADDVKCSHGSATGQLDEEAIFYLRSRGIGAKEAKELLVYAFAGEMVGRVPSAYLQKPVEKMVQDWMGEKRS